ncbi:MAG: hypothetical protein ACRYG5_03000 [Janthinobacterium lividum]
MKKVLIASLAAALLSSGFAIAPAVAANASTTTSTAKKAPARKRILRRKASRKSAAVAAPLAEAAPPGAERWSCEEAASFYVGGDMKRDQILTVTWKSRNYHLPRVTTTTGADRFYDPASGIDLVVIPTKAMLFDDNGERTRLADECKTQQMVQNASPAPTQSVELNKKLN